MLLLASCVGLAGWALATGAGALLSALLCRGLRPLSAGLTPAARARRLLLLGLLPSGLALLVVAGWLLPAFALHEPRDAREAIGPGLALLAAAGAALLASGARRAWRAWRHTARLTRRWASDGSRFDPAQLDAPGHRFEWPFPVVSVVGLSRPRLFVAEQVLEACDPEELRAVLAHEAAHLSARDNLKRLLLEAAPDPLALTALGAELRAQWQTEAEAAADEAAAAQAPELRLALASALLRLARLASGGVRLLPGSAACDGSPVEARVRRLLAEAPAGAAPAAPTALLLGAAAILLATGLAQLDRVHAATELLVALLG